MVDEALLFQRADLDLKGKASHIQCTKFVP